MSDSAFELPLDEPLDTAEFLRRLGGMMTGSRNAEFLQRAAGMIESLSHRAAVAEQLLAEQQDDHARAISLRQASEMATDRLITEIESLKAELVDYQLRLASERERADDEARALKAQLDEANARAARIEGDFDSYRSAANASSSVMVPVQTLQLARAQFDHLSELFAKNGDIVSHTISEIGGCAIDQVLAGRGSK